MSCFIIAEAGVNHNGDQSLALQLVEVAAESGADAIKFQTFKADELVTSGAQKAEYQARETGGGDQLEMLKALEMSEQMHKAVYDKCLECGIEFMSTPFDTAAVDYLLDLGMKRIKIPSGEITNHPFLTYVAKKNVPLIMSTGMASMNEIIEAVNLIAAVREEAGHKEPLVSMLTILHCTSNYPAALDDVNLRAMTSIQNETGVPIGYSDHTLGITVSTAAVARRATVIEKHFTLNRDMSGPDHSASLEPEELKAMVRQIRDVELALGSSVKEPTETELPVRELVRRSVTAVVDLKAGATIREEDVALMRPGHGIAPKFLGSIIGAKILKDIKAGTTLVFSDIEL